MPTITTTYKGDGLLESTVGRHALLIDVPATMGGKDRAIQPPQLFIASLGSCVGAMIADYCERHQLDASGMEVHVDYEKAEKPSRLIDINVRVVLPNMTTSDAGKIAVLRRVAEHCPVHKTMEDCEGVHFDFQLG